jgi:hypothetical protein
VRELEVGIFKLEESELELELEVSCTDSAALGQSGALLKGQGSHDLDLVKGHKWPVKGLCASGQQGLDPLFILFYSILF